MSRRAISGSAGNPARRSSTGCGGCTRASGCKTASSISTAPENALHVPFARSRRSHLHRLGPNERDRSGVARLGQRQPVAERDPVVVIAEQHCVFLEARPLLVGVLAAGPRVAPAKPLAASAEQLRDAFTVETVRVLPRVDTDRKVARFQRGAIDRDPVVVGSFGVVGPEVESERVDVEGVPGWREGVDLVGEEFWIVASASASVSSGKPTMENTCTARPASTQFRRVRRAIGREMPLSMWSSVFCDPDSSPKKSLRIPIAYRPSQISGENPGSRRAYPTKRGSISGVFSSSRPSRVRKAGESVSSVISKCRTPCRAFSVATSAATTSGVRHAVRPGRDAVDGRDVAELAPVEVATFAREDGKYRRRGQVPVQRQAVEVGCRESRRVLEVHGSGDHLPVMAECKDIGETDDVSSRGDCAGELEERGLAFVRDERVAERLEEAGSAKELRYELRVHRSADDDEVPGPAQHAPRA